MSMTVTMVVIISTILYHHVGVSSYHNVVMVRPHSQLNVKLSSQDSHGFRSTNFGYVVALRYTGQQGTGIQALMSLQCFIGSLNLSMYILEPSMIDTRFGSFFDLSKSYSSSSLLRFSDIFDIAHFNNASRSMGFAEIKSENEFKMNAPRDVILIESFRSVESPATLVWTSKEKEDCYNDQHVPKGYCIRRIISVTGKRDIKVSYQIFTEDELLSIVLGPWSSQEVTLVFREWHTPWYVLSPSLPNPVHCKDIRSTSTETQFHTSSALLADAQRYEDHFLGSKNKLAIMFRIERMMIYLTILKNRKKIDSIETSVTKCLNKVVHLVEERWKKHGFSTPLVTLDLGKYGSVSWRDRNIALSHNVTGQAKFTLSNLFHSQWSFNEWEDSFTEVASIPVSSGYIAAFQRTLASRADCLVLVGGGYFQELALNDYKRNHPDRSTWCIYIVCAINSVRLQEDVQRNHIDVYEV